MSWFRSPPRRERSLRVRTGCGDELRLNRADQPTVEKPRASRATLATTDRYGWGEHGWLGPRRISAFVSWLARRTPWPVFTLGMLQADIIGALLVLGF